MNRVLMRTNQQSEMAEETFDLIGNGPVRIGVIPSSRGAGATLISLALAQLLAQQDKKGRDRITYLELRGNTVGPTVYDWTGMEKRFAGRNFWDFFSMAKIQEPFRQRLNLDEGINWVLPLPEDWSSDFAQRARLIRRAPGSILICDFSIFPEVGEHLADMDVLILVVDPAPSGLLASLPILREVRRMEEAGMPVIRVLNKWNEGIEKREVLRFLQDRNPLTITDIPYEAICRCQFSCYLPLNDPGISSRMKLPLEKIIHRIFP